IVCPLAQDPKEASPQCRAEVVNSLVGYALEKKVVKSKVGEKVGLPCCHEIPSSESLHSYRVYWQKNTTEVVLAYADGKMISKHEQYVNRTEMDARNLTLWISPVEILDNGSYQCIVQHRRLLQNSVVVCDESVTLFVTGRWIMVVRCSSYGGFPKPKLSGALDNESTAWNDSWVSESSLRAYNVTGKLWLNVTKDISFTCSVEYNGFAESTSFGSHRLGLPPFSAPLYQHDLAASCVVQTWYSNGGT
uniref:Ig-like domain-containing protein n=1 Tax=Buteo japonicus TaxID=224669 RepID=A0A8C0B037_9AVES